MESLFWNKKFSLLALMKEIDFSEFWSEVLPSSVRTIKIWKIWKFAETPIIGMNFSKQIGYTNDMERFFVDRFLLKHSKLSWVSLKILIWNFYVHP